MKNNVAGGHRLRPPTLLIKVHAHLVSIERQRHFRILGAAGDAQRELEALPYKSLEVLRSASCNLRKVGLFKRPDCYWNAVRSTTGM